jgi:hypothetical protein
MIEVLKNLCFATLDIPRVVENGHLLVEMLGGGGGGFVVLEERTRRESLAILSLQRVIPLSLHVGETPGTTALGLPDDIREYSITVWEFRCHFANGFAEGVEPGRIETQRLEAGFQWAFRPPAPRTFRANDSPFRMLLSHPIIHTGCDVNGHIDVDFFTRIKLRTKQIEREMGVHGAHLRLEITPSMVAGREGGDRIDARIPQRFLVRSLVEFLTNIRDGRRGVEVEMDLAKTEMMHGLIRLFGYEM